MGSRARSFGRWAVGEGFLDQDEYANMAARFLFLHNIFFRYEKPVARFQNFSRHAEPELKKQWSVILLIIDFSTIELPIFKLNYVSITRGQKANPNREMNQLHTYH